MTNYEEIKQGLADYEAKVAKANAKFPDYVSWAVVDDARLCRLCYSRGNQCPL